MKSRFNGLFVTNGVLKNNKNASSSSILKKEELIRNLDENEKDPIEKKGTFLVDIRKYIKSENFPLSRQTK